LFDEYLIRNIKMRQSTPYYVSFSSETGRPDSYEAIKKELKPGVTEQMFVEYYDNVITNDQCILEYDFPLVSVKRILHVKQGGFSIRELCGVVCRDFIDIYREQLWVPDATLQPKDLCVNTFFVFNEPITVPADPNLCVTRITLGIEPKVIMKLKDLTEQSKSKGSIKRMMKKITEIAQENALNAVQAPIIKVEPIMKTPMSLATLADSLPDEDEEDDDTMTKIVTEILPEVAPHVKEAQRQRTSDSKGSVVTTSSSSRTSSSVETITNSSMDESVAQDSPKKDAKKKPAAKRARTSTTTKTTKAPPKKKTKETIEPEVEAVSSANPVASATPVPAPAGPTDDATGKPAAAPKKKGALKKGSVKKAPIA